MLLKASYMPLSNESVFFSVIEKVRRGDVYTIYIIYSLSTARNIFKYKKIRF